MIRVLRITPLARLELENLAFHIAKDSVDNAANLRLKLAETGESLLAYPQAFPIYPHRVAEELGLRKRSIKGFPNHLLFYVVSPDTVEIRRVIHGSPDVPKALFESPADDS